MGNAPVYFVWKPDGMRPLLLIAGGSGVVPLWSSPSPAEPPGYAK
jgi:ferredoxin-NADP reductase